MAARSERLIALRFAGVFAAATTTVWAVLQAFPLEYQLEPLGNVYSVLNVGGLLLWWLILGLLYDPSYTDSAVAWAWLLTTQFVAAFVQGLAYALLWSIVRGTWTRSRLRAIAYPLAVAAASYKSFTAGVDHFHKVNCSGAGFDGDCDLGIFDGMTWAAIALGVAIAVVALIEALIRKASRSASGP